MSIEENNLVKKLFIDNGFNELCLNIHTFDPKTNSNILH